MEFPGLGEQFSKTSWHKIKVVVLGDLMLDHYIHGHVSRISPEAPVPVLKHQREQEVLGGAANVGCNLVGLGAKAAVLGVAGDDAAANRLKDLAQQRNIELDIVTDISRPTTAKLRVVAGQQQVVRIDREESRELSIDIRNQLLTKLKVHLEESSALILSDYGKGVISTQIAQSAIEVATAMNVPILVDPKGMSFEKYRGATFITPNSGEFAAICGDENDDISLTTRKAQTLTGELGLQGLIVTLGARGILWATNSEHGHQPALAKEVFDVSGAGDTVISTLAASLGANWDLRDAVYLANMAASIVVGKHGTAPIEAAELEAAASTTDRQVREAFLETHRWDSASELVDYWRAKGERVVFTNGCFDLLHVGHITLLEKAKALGHRLVIGLNSDRSVSELKGQSRPIVEDGNRARVLSALSSVDLVVLFDEDTPIDLIKALKPDILVKGEDYRGKLVVGQAEVESWGGRVELVPLVEGQSTTNLAARSKERLPS